MTSLNSFTQRISSQLFQFVFSILFSVNGYKRDMLNFLGFFNFRASSSYLYSGLLSAAEDPPMNVVEPRSGCMKSF